ncbi:MAG: B12-binding domain-containing radical SAM protein, partial [Deltaproteobacteria bacterium]|nr:B12-binding domain-containing radical SAM protein [Deltaproteobacteria bacterium]
MKFAFLEPKAPGRHIFSRIQLPRLGNVLLATLLARRGHQCRVLIEEVRPIRPEDLEWADVVGISSTTSTAPAAYRWAAAARRLGKRVVMGGPHVTFLPDEALEHADFVVRGEGEETLLELAEALEGEREPSGILGLSYLDAGGTRHNPSRPLLTDLDALPSPDFSFVEGWKPSRVLPLSTSRGCPFACRFCSVVPMFGSRYRFQSVGRVLEDLGRYASSTQHVFFCDDNFAARPRRAKEICRGILDRGMKLEWSAQVRTDCANDPELLDLMARAGCWCVFLGLESINPRTLEAYDKRQSVDDIRRGVAAFRERRIRTHGMFVSGCDTDDRQTLRETVRFAREAAIDTVQFLNLTPAPGTPIFEEMERAGRIRTRDWSLYDAHHVVFEPVRFTPDELQNETQRASARFYSLRGAVRTLMRRDLFGFGLRLFAWQESRRNRLGKRPFLHGLRGELLRGAAKLKELLPTERVRSVALPTVGLSDDQKRFLLEFVRHKDERAQVKRLLAESLENRLKCMSTTHFGLSSPVMNVSRLEAGARLALASVRAASRALDITADAAIKKPKRREKETGVDFSLVDYTRGIS